MSWKTEYESEPDSLVWEACGLHCELSRGPLGHWCGYVGVEKDHPLYEKGYSENLDVLLPSLGRRQKKPLGESPSFAVLATVIFGGELEPCMSMVFEVHGGVTYAGYNDESESLWLIGFDCSHSGDLCPSSPFQEGVYRNMEYAKKETEKLAAQIKATLIKEVS